MGYCDGNCEFLEKQKRHTCAKYGKKLTHMKQTGGISFEVHEQCTMCQKDEWIKKCEEKIKKSDELLNELLKSATDSSDYRAGILEVLKKLTFYD